MTTCVGRQSVSTRPWASRLRAYGGDGRRGAVQAEPTPPGQRPRRGRAPAVGRGTSGSRWASTPTASRTSSSSGSSARVHRRGAEPARRGRARGAGTSTRPRPGAAVASTRSARPRWSAPCRRGEVDPADQLEVDRVGEGPACASASVARCQVVELVAPGRPGRRTPGAQVRRPGARRPARRSRRRISMGGRISRAGVGPAGPRAGSRGRARGDPVEHVRERLDRGVGDDLRVGGSGLGQRLVVVGPHRPQLVEVTDDVDAGRRGSRSSQLAGDRLDRGAPPGRHRGAAPCRAAGRAPP